MSVLNTGRLQGTGVNILSRKGRFFLVPTTTATVHSIERPPIGALGKEPLGI